MKKRSLAILLALLLTLGLSACGGSAGGSDRNASGSTASAPAEAYGAEMPMEAQSAYWDNASMKAAEEDGGTAKQRPDLPEGVKMIYRASLELETQEFERAAADIDALVLRMGGYCENQSLRNGYGGYRSASYTVRIPAEKFEDFLSQIGSVCAVTWQTRSAEDVSERYYDAESRLETAKIKLDRLQELLSKAEVMEDIITLESAISETEYQIESLSGELRHYDALVGYSTVELNLNEVYRVTEVQTAPLSFGQRLGNAFRSGLEDFAENAEDFAEWLAYSWLGLLLFAAVVTGVVLLIRRLRRGRTPKQPKKESAPAANAGEEKKE